MAGSIIRTGGRVNRTAANRIAAPMHSVVDKYLGPLSLAAGLILWEGAGRLLALPWLPPFSEVLGALAELTAEGHILSNLATSLQNLAIGFVIALVGGLVVGGLMGRYRLINEALDAYVFALFISPTMIFVPIFFAIFGLSGGTLIAIVVVYAVFVIIINTATAIRTVDTSLIEMARSYGAKERQIFFRILVPGSLPLIFAGVQLGMGRAVKGMINGEMFIALVGLGALAQRFGGQFDAASSLAIALVILIVALVLNRLVKLVDNRLTFWTE